MLWRRKIVRDLEWVFSSPHLLSSNFSVLPKAICTTVLSLPATQKWLDALHGDPGLLYLFLAEKRRENTSLALGVYFAALLEFWLRFCPSWTVEKFAVGQQLVARKSAQTVGQLKFVFRLTMPPTPPIDMHWEASIKFFLLSDADERPCKLEHFVGPHLGENLAWRAQEVQRKLDMCRLDAVRSWMASHFEWTAAQMDDHHTASSHMILRGYLFYPLSHRAATTSLDVETMTKDIEPTHLRGWWTIDYETELTRAAPPTAKWAILPKVHWLSPVVAQDQGSVAAVITGDEHLGLDDIVAMDRATLFSTCRAHFAHCDSAMPLLVAELHPSNKDTTQYIEISRGFVMNPKTWNPAPLTGDALRYRRHRSKNKQATDLNTLFTSTPWDVSMEREYEQRRRVDAMAVCMKHDNNEVERQPKVTFDATMTPPTLVRQIHMLLMERQAGINYEAIKAATKTFLQNGRTREFLVDCIVALRELGDENEAKDVLRVGHLLLDSSANDYDADENAQKDEAVAQKLEAFTVQQLTKEDGWWILRFLVKATRSLAPKFTPSAHSVQNAVATTVWTILDSQSQRWNATVVDLCDLYGYPATVDDAAKVLHALLAGHDAINAEAFVLATLAHGGDDATCLIQAFLHHPNTPAKTARRFATHSSVARNTLSPERDQPLPSLDHVHHRRLVDQTTVVTTTHLVDCPDGVVELTSYINNLQAQHVVGIDCEWRPRHFQSTEEERVQLIQLAFSDTVYILDAVALDNHGADRPLVETVLALIFNSPRFILAGFCVAGDIHRLRATYPSLDHSCPVLSNCVEVRRLAVARVGDNVSSWGLAALVSTYLGQTIEKDQQCSDWGLRPLTPEQLRYAAEDAQCARRLFFYFVADLVSQLEPLLCDSHVWHPWLVRERPRDHLSYLQESDVVNAVNKLGLGSANLCQPLPAHNSLSHVVVKTVAFVVQNAQAEAMYLAVVVDIAKSIDVDLLRIGLGISSTSHIALASDAVLFPRIYCTYLATDVGALGQSVCGSRVASPSFSMLCSWTRK
ncbi:Aste57867_17691 [Aphanomyces stellatus]|uniref:Aste57867_17691 protein n=1 Tax=Aphanomyces stellatus TaxID=120398 RepID=A0A485L881_9STRA|nr:hypothetical protein As57867_017630 [Aphanomyces stellatus]VFT94441.1 Aste57867_17691 [Aphanomyces stellatus]